MSSDAKIFVQLSQPSSSFCRKRMRLRLRLLLLFALLLSVACLLPQLQKDSLVALFNATGGPNWTNKANWNASTDPCTAFWFGISCDALKQNVTGLALASNNLIGSLPDLQLPALVSLLGEPSAPPLRSALIHLP